MPFVVGNKNLSEEEVAAAKNAGIQQTDHIPQQNAETLSKERTGAQILAQPLAGGVLFPSLWDEGRSYADIWGDEYTDFPGFPCGDLNDLGNDALGNTSWNYFYSKRAIWYRRIRAMRRDPTINLARILSIAPILAAGWSYEETEKAKKYPEAKAFIESEYEPLRLQLINQGFLQLLDFGWCAFEKVFDYIEEENKIRIKKLKHLLPDLTHIRVDQTTGEFVGLQQFQNFASWERNMIINLDYDESLLYNIDVEGTNHYGNSVMRVAEMPHRYSLIANEAAKQYDKKIAGSHWVIHYPIGNTPFGPNAADTDNFIIAQTLIRTLESSGAVAVPTLISPIVGDLQTVGGEFAEEKRDWRIEILSDNSGGSQSFDTRLRYLDSLKFRAFGLPERSATEGQFGTKAESATQIDFALTHIMFRGDMFCQQTNKGVVNQSLRYNYGEDAENSVYIKQKPLTDEQKTRLFQLYMKLLDLPSMEPREVNDIDHAEMKKILNIPIIAEAQEQLDSGNEDQSQPDNQNTLNDVMRSINQDYNMLPQTNTDGNNGGGNQSGPYDDRGNFNREALMRRIRGERN